MLIDTLPFLMLNWRVVLADRALAQIRAHEGTHHTPVVPAEARQHRKSCSLSYQQLLWSQEAAGSCLSDRRGLAGKRSGHAVQRPHRVCGLIPEL